MKIYCVQSFYFDNENIIVYNLYKRIKLKGWSVTNLKNNIQFGTLNEPVHIFTWIE